VSLRGIRGYVALLYCSVFEQHIHSCRIFSSAWIAGSANKKLSNVIDHATSDAHKAAVSKEQVSEVICQYFQVENFASPL